MKKQDPRLPNESFADFQKRLGEWHKKDWVEHLQDEAGLHEKKAYLDRLTEYSHFCLFGLVIFLILFLGTAQKPLPLISMVFAGLCFVSFVICFALIAKGARPFGKNSSLMSDREKGFRHD